MCSEWKACAKSYSNRQSISPKMDQEPPLRRAAWPNLARCCAWRLRRGAPRPLRAPWGMFVSRPGATWRIRPRCGQGLCKERHACNPRVRGSYRCCQQFKGPKTCPTTYVARRRYVVPVQRRASVAKRWHRAKLVAEMRLNQLQNRRGGARRGRNPCLDAFSDRIAMRMEHNGPHGAWRCRVGAR